MQTSMGTITLELDAARAPATVANFLAYAEAGYYDGLIFHRVPPGFVIQGGGYTPDFRHRPTRPPVRNEADNGLSNLRGTIAMARTDDPHSATAQFFISLRDNPELDFVDKTREGWGYTVFGRVIEGLDVVDRIGAVPTGANGPFDRDCPLEPVIIESVRRQPVQS